ncbi:hypothetical protein P8C59_001630 [Phyllachora maydis]|uniref:Integrase catalytic domain-containing protein n=1 Tax=Phyllachora maydis TaxID=1825666 RepID=A0AAD9HYR9_9PEZI|nr:hypothetical protein P8C59_001630 [Phyllachora maydis]
MADRAKGKGIAPKRASNPADPGQSSRPPLPIRTLLKDKEDSKDYSEVIEVLKQHIKSYKRDSVSAIKNTSSTLASLTNSSNAAATRKTSYSPRFNPFSGTMDLDSPPRPPRKEPYLGPAVNSATSNLDPPIDIGSKEGFKDTITSSIVKELSKKAYTIPDDSKLSRESNFEQWIQALSIVLRALGISNFLENPNISNTYSDSDQAVLLMLLCDSLSSGPRAAISRPIESKKEDVYNEFHALTFSTYRKGLSAFNAEFNGYLAKLTIAKIDIDPSLILNQYFKALESKFPSWVSRQKSSIRQARMLGVTASSLNIEYLMADILEESRNPAIEAYRAAYVANSSNSTPNSNSNPSKKGKNKKKGSYNLAIEEEEESDSSSNSNHISNSKERFTTFTPNTGQLRPINTGNSPVSPAGIGSIILEVLSRKAPPTYTKLKSGFFLDIKGSSKPILHANFAFPLGLSSYTTKSIELQRNKILVEIPSNPIRKEDYRPIIEDAIVSEAIEPNKRYKLRNSPAKGTTLEGVGPSLRGKRPRRPTREPKPLTGTRDLPCMLREPVIEGNEVEKAISSPTLKEPNIGQRDYYNLLNLAKLWHVRLGHIGLRLLKKTSSINKGLPNFDKLKEADFHCSSCDREGDTVKIRPRPYNRNPIVLLLVDRKSRYRWVFNLPNKSGPIVANAIKGFFRGLRNGFSRYPTKFHFDGGTEITDLLTTWLAKRGIEFSTSAPYIHEQNGLVERSVRVILDRWLSRSLNRPTKSHLNAAKNLFKYLNSTKDYSICFSYNGNTVADLGPKLSNSSNTTTKLSRDFHSEEGPRPLTTTSTTIVDSRNSKGSSRTSIINSSLVPIGFSDSDFTGDKATSKSTYGYLYKLAGGPISWKTKRATTIALSTLEAETDGLIEAIREVQWIIGLFSELHRPIDYPITLYGDNQGSITVANNPALHARTKHTLLKFRYVREQVKAKIFTIIYLNTNAIAIAIATTTAAATTTTTTTSATDSTTAITATRPSDISFNSPFKGLSSTL